MAVRIWRQLSVMAVAAVMATWHVPEGLFQSQNSRVMRFPPPEQTLTGREELHDARPDGDGTVVRGHVPVLDVCAVLRRGGAELAVAFVAHFVVGGRDLLPPRRFAHG